MEYLPYFLATIGVCGLIITGSALSYFGKTKALAAFVGYQGLALKVFDTVEANIPDTFGSDTDDGKLQKSVHKLDLFLKQFGELYKKTSGKNMTAALKAEAMTWVQIWADQKKAEESMKEEVSKEMTHG
jgi:hypothetical protein